MDTIRIGAARGCCERTVIQGPNRGRVKLSIKALLWGRADGITASARWKLVKIPRTTYDALRM